MLTPEANVVLLTAGGRETDDRLAALLRGPLDWRRVVAIAAQQRATHALTQRLGALAPPGVPPEVTDTLRRASMIARFRQLHLEQRLRAAISLLQDQGVRVLLLKGAALAITVYDSFEDRPMGDLDLLIDAERAAPAQQALLLSGWRRIRDEPLDEFYDDHQHLPPLEDVSGAGIGLELHTGLFFRGHPFQLSTDELWADAVQVKFGGGTAAVPSTKHLLLHLCTHFAWSHMARSGTWRAFRDLHALNRRGQIPWESLGAEAHRARAASCCYWTLRLARDVTALPVPDAVLAELQPPYRDRTLAILTRHFETGLVPSPTNCPSVRLSRWMWEAAIRPRWSGHGRQRPWQRSGSEARAFPKGQPVRGMDKLRLHVHQLQLWRRYAATLLRSPSATAVTPE